MRTKSHLPKDSKRDTTGRGSARKSASTRASAERNANVEVEATLTDRESHDHLPKKSRRDNTGPESARESASTRASAKWDAKLRVKATLTNRQPHLHLVNESRRDNTGPDIMCRDKPDWLMRCYQCAVNNYPEENCPPMPLILPNGHTSLCKKAEVAAKGILPPPLKMVLKTHYPLRVKQQPQTSPPSNNRHPLHRCCQVLSLVVRRRPDRQRVQVFGEEKNIEGKIEPERRMLESSMSSTGVEALGQLSLPGREM